MLIKLLIALSPSCSLKAHSVLGMTAFPIFEKSLGTNSLHLLGFFFFFSSKVLEGYSDSKSRL